MHLTVNSRPWLNAAGCLIAAGLLVFATGPALSSDGRDIKAKKVDTLPPAAECGSCTRRHQALAKAKKLRDRKKAIPIAKAKPKPKRPNPSPE